MADATTSTLEPRRGPVVEPVVEVVRPERPCHVAPSEERRMPADGSQVVVWRWFDAVVVDVGSASLSLWEPAHGTVLAVPRDRQRSYLPGSRAYLSAGLPGAQCWVAGPVVDRAEDADVDLDEVEQFLTGLGL